MTEDNEKIYKEFKYPNDKVLKLTKEDFQAIVEYFIWLDRQATKLREERKIPDKDWIEVDEDLMKAIKGHGSTEIISISRSKPSK